MSGKQFTRLFGTLPHTSGPFIAGASSRSGTLGLTPLLLLLAGVLIAMAAPALVLAVLGAVFLFLGSVALAIGWKFRKIKRDLEAAIRSHQQSFQQESGFDDSAQRFRSGVESGRPVSSATGSAEVWATDDKGDPIEVTVVGRSEQEIFLRGEERSGARKVILH